MDSVVILERYLTGQAQRKETREAFNEALRLAPFREKTKVKVAYGTFIRYTMFKEGTASAFEVLLKLRDLILFNRKVLCGDTIGEMISEYGATIGLHRDYDGYAYVNLSWPKWIGNEQFVNNTYALNYCREEEDYALTDQLLTNSVKKFKTYKSFEIKAAVHTAMNLPVGYTLLVSLPTGAGKSLITQMVSYYTEGLTIVVVPTVALAMDQYYSAIETLGDSFREHIFYYRGGQSDQAYAEIIEGIKTQKARLLFISPEALMKNNALNILLNRCAADKYLRNIVIDEAHIVPDWGILFRPDFQILSFVVKRWKVHSQNELRVYLLSATLPEDTTAVLKHLFASDGKVIEYRCDALRREPQFCFYETKSYSQRLDAVEEALMLLPKPMIVYFLEPAEVVAFQKRMQDKGYLNIQAFHGDTKDSDREKILADWKAERIDIILATSAFGIGVDKSNVRTVIHACIPENLSRFYQEVGRAGRDGYSSLSVLIPYTGKGHKGSDLENAYGLVKGRVLRVETMVSRWKGLLDHAMVDGDVISVDTATVPSYFTDEAAEYAGARNSGWNINLLLFLHRNGYIDIQDAVYRMDTKSYHFTAKILKVAELSDMNLMARAIEEAREEELNVQLDGYSRMKHLVQRPDKRCWGMIFHDLYPLTDGCCNGCPKHRRNTNSLDEPYRIRAKIDYAKNAVQKSQKLAFAMGSYDNLIVRNRRFPEIDISEVLQVVKAMNDAGVKTLVGNAEIVSTIPFNGMILTTDEFSFMASVYPGCFASGVIAVFDENEYSNSTLCNNLLKLREYGYRSVLYCSDDMYIQGANRRITDFLNCKIRNPRELK